MGWFHSALKIYHRSVRLQTNYGSSWFSNPLPSCAFCSIREGGKGREGEGRRGREGGGREGEGRGREGVGMADMPTITNLPSHKIVLLLTVSLLRP